jgi:hypothetical protein
MTREPRAQIGVGQGAVVVRADVLFGELFEFRRTFTARPRPPVWLCRSCCSSRFTTFQPSFSLPSRSVFSAMALSKYVSQNGDAPAISLIGRVRTPG